MFRRNVEEKLTQYLKVFPVVLLTGARQTGKTTLVKEFAKVNKYSYITLDDASSLYAVKEDPIGFLKLHTTPLIIDEVQRAPELFLSIKQLVDEENTLGQFILTGSANPLLLPKLGDSLAGRMGVLSMFPFSQGELKGKKEDFLSWIFSTEFKVSTFSDLDINKLGEIIYKGGFPRACSLKSNKEIEIWIEGYLRTLIERDVRDLSKIDGLHNFSYLLKLIANRSGSLFNGADIARSLKISTLSVRRYIVLLEAIFLVFKEEAWFLNNTKRTTKSPKIYICDSGVLSYLLKGSADTFKTNPSLFGFLLESFIVSELLKQASWADEKINQYHFREGSREVDVVLEERGGNIVGIEIKKAATIRPSDFVGLKLLKKTAGDKFIRGIVFYTGSKIVPFAGDLFAVPISSLWEK
jgi:predicted AAA+ superfamily ATPase